MPSKVVTRRQRKAAEAKRQCQEELQLIITDSQHTSETRITLPMLDQQPTCSGAKSEQKANGVELTKENKPLANQACEVDKNPVGKAKMTIVVNDEEKKVFDRLVEDLNKNSNTNNAASDATRSPSPSEHVSITKSLTRRAVATFSKIQKLSKAFNRKFNLEQSIAKVAEQINLSAAQQDESLNTALNGPGGHQSTLCNCEFCKVVLSQLLVGKKRSNDKKHCKNSGKRLSNRRRSMSPGRNNVAKPEDLESKSELCNLHTHPDGVERRAVHESERPTNKDLRILNQGKIPRSVNVLGQQTMPEEVSEPYPPNQHATPQELQPSIRATTEFKEQNIDDDDVTQVEFSIAAGDHIRSRSMRINQTNYKPSVLPCIPEKSSVSPYGPSAVSLFGNSGYFLLTGTSSQMAIKLRSLGAKNINVQSCVMLEPNNVHDIVVQQLNELYRNRENILNNMIYKQDIFATRRQRRSKEPSKYN